MCCHLIPVCKVFCKIVFTEETYYKKYQSICYSCSTDDQSVATRFSRQVNRATKLIQAHVEAYKTKEPESGCPSTFTFEEAIDTSIGAYLSALSDIQVHILFLCYAHSNCTSGGIKS